MCHYWPGKTIAHIAIDGSQTERARLAETQVCMNKAPRCAPGAQFGMREGELGACISPTNSPHLGPPDITEQPIKNIKLCILLRPSLGLFFLLLDYDGRGCNKGWECAGMGMIC